MNELTLAACSIAIPAALPQAQEGGTREPAPDFALADLDGRTHRLADLRGRVVVLEWTSHVCPAVAAVQESRIAADARGALDPEVVWLQIDSSWFAPALADDVRDWRRRLGLEVPYLFDSDGSVAQSYGAAATPHFYVVDTEGRLAYSGALHDGASEPERRDHVVEAVAALRAGESVPVERTRAIGCSVKLGDPRAAVSAEKVDQDAAARALYRRAASAARSGEDDQAVLFFARAREAGLPRPWSVLADGAFRGLLADPEARRAIRASLGERPARGRLTMVAPDEPGESFVLCGTVRDGSGRPITGAVVSLYQTDAAGWYSAGSTSGENPRLSGRVATDRNGRYRIRTVVPGHYADATNSPAHVHMDVRAAGFRAFGGHRASVYFADDPALVGANRAEIESDGCAIRPRRKNAEGVTLCVHDVTLYRE